MKTAVAQAREQFGRIDGVFHAAGMLDDGPLMLKTAANPGGLPMKVFDEIRAGSVAGRSQFYKNLASGPGKLTQALAVDKSFNRADMINGRELYAASCGNEKFTVTKGPRIGIKKGLDLNRRFCVKNSRYLSA